jgi:hypothetical protein
VLTKMGFLVRFEIDNLIFIMGMIGELRTSAQMLARESEYKPCVRPEVPMSGERMCVMQAMMKAFEPKRKEFELYDEIGSTDLKVVIEDEPEGEGVSVKIYLNGGLTEDEVLINVRTRAEIMNELLETVLWRWETQLIFAEVVNYILERAAERFRWKWEKERLAPECTGAKYYVPGDAECPCHVLQRAIREELGVDFDEEAFLEDQT